MEEKTNENEGEVIKLFYDMNAYENANYYFQLAKKYAKKAEQARKAIEEMKKKNLKKEEKTKQNIVISMPYFYTSVKNLYCTAGRNAEENEKLLRKSTENDLLFHADIQGASTVLLRDGINAEIDDKLDAACYAACYSKAWVFGYSSIDVYAFKKQQVYKEQQKAGAFNISGEREWFKNMPLRLKVALIGNEIFILPYRWHGNKEITKQVEIRPGNIDKNQVSKKLSEIFKCDENYIKSILPQGKFVIKKE
ncbi:MAG: NFACT RNA binding domain-containing protein [Candidatus Anstonellales archaeon]